MAHCQVRYCFSMELDPSSLERKDRRCDMAAGAANSEDLSMLLKHRGADFFGEELGADWIR